MQIQDTPRATQTWPEDIGLPPGLPEGAEIQHVEFVTGADAAQTTLMEFKEPHPCRAVLVAGPAAAPPAGLTMLLVPTTDQEDPELVANVWSWVEPGVPQELRSGLLIMLQGARIIWSPGRAGLIASAERLDALRRAVIDFSFFDGEARRFEAELSEAWPHLEADTPLAFRFDAQAMPRRDELARRFQRVIGLRARLVQISPAVNSPPVHPPTLASQLKERLKERSRLAERIEFIDDQLDLLERVYEMCGHRSSEHVIAQNEARLEWIVIILLATETVALLVDLMAANRI
ncbi:hypothetical protein BE08_37945 [Sorangium cellulosum]|uniref:DUF155 domain-containing protein n=1 Tax=Sorangium cellulosum TaxID=56 RepID=A0A150PSQ4_SORCE|nr:hypothetical protein BE08_37945 [Sorangium cellulosum]